MATRIKNKVVAARSQLQRLLHEVSKKDFTIRNDQDAVRLQKYVKNATRDISDVLERIGNHRIEWTEQIESLVDEAKEREMKNKEEYEQGEDGLEEVLEDAKATMAVLEENDKNIAKYISEDKKGTRTEKNPPEEEEVDQQEGDDEGEPTVTYGREKPNLPRLNLPTFDGSSSWQQYIDAFNASVGSNRKLSDLDKVQYLMGTLIGEARDLVEGFPITGPSYKNIMVTLEEEYGDSKQIIEELYRKLMRLRRCDNTSESAHTTIREISKLCRQLEQMGENLDTRQFEITIKERLAPWLLDRVLKQVRKDGYWDTMDVLKYCRQEIRDRRTVEEIDGSLKVKVKVTSLRVPEREERRKKTIECFLCKDPHFVEQCTKYPTPADRRQAAIRMNRCFRCLRDSHQAAQCTCPPWKCKTCGRTEHHSSICTAKQRPAWQGKSRSDDKAKNMKATSLNSDEDVLLLTRMVKAKNPRSEKTKECAIFLDCGSQVSFITEKLADQLGLQRNESEVMRIIPFGGQQKELQTRKTKVDIRKENGSTMSVTVCTTPEITEDLVRMGEDGWPKESRPDILIGADFFWRVIRDVRGPEANGLYTVRTIFGPMKTGKMVMGVRGALEDKMTDTKSIESEVEKLWSLEAIGIRDDPRQTDDEVALRKFEEVTVQQEDGRYVSGWPWKEEDEDLPTNRTLCLGRLRSNVKKLRELNLLDKYDDVIKEQLNREIIEKVDEKLRPKGKVHYLAHHPVINEQKKTTKMRIVYYASAGKKSLNKALLAGPSMMGDMVGMILRMRTKHGIVLGDLEKAFHQIALREEDREAVRFIWLRDVSKPVEEDNIQVYRFTRVPFGVISSPFLLNATIRKHLNKSGTEVAKEMCRNIYADNIFLSAASTEEGLRKASEAKEIFANARMVLCQFSSNIPEIQATLADDPMETETGFLGIPWNIRTDEMTIKTLAANEEPVSRRMVLSQISSTFDPLGLLSPAFLESRKFFQSLPNVQGWKEILNEEQQEEWKRIRRGFANQKISFKRRIEINEESEIHAFSDASNMGYGVAVYVRTPCKDGVKTFLVFAKSRVTPKKSDKEKPITIPRLELIGAETAAKAVKFVKENLDSDIKRTYLHTDSKCVLGWIFSKKEKLEKFVENRIAKIREVQWTAVRYVPTECNPGDIASRGCTLEQLKESELWWNGPAWLTKSEEFWPETPKYDIHWEENQPEEADTQVKVMTVLRRRPNGEPVIDTRRFSKLCKLTNTLAFVLRAKGIWLSMKGQNNEVKTGRTSLTSAEVKAAVRRIDPPTAREKTNALKMLIQQSYSEHPPDDVHVSNLGLQDEDGLLKCVGRLGRSELPDRMKYPIFVHNKADLARLLISDAHERTNHGEHSVTKAALWEQFWIPSPKRKVKSVIDKCYFCRKWKSKPIKRPAMAELPKERVQRARPFENVGVDFCGPFQVRSKGSGTEKCKVWIALFSCMATRAAHLEVADGLSATAFIKTFRRFVARRGRPNFIVSDNGSNFVSASKAILKVWLDSEDDGSAETIQFAEYLAKEGVEWKFITPLSPWEGGFYERMMSFVKKGLTGAIGRNVLDVEEFATTVAEVEAIINSRPLFQVEYDEVVRPADFLNPSATIGAPRIDAEEEFRIDESTQEKLVDGWKKSTRILDRFWEKWRNYYLTGLRERHQKNHKDPRGAQQIRIKPGDVVIMVEDGQPRGQWKLGITEDVKPGERSAQVRTADGSRYWRSVAHLVPLEVTSERNEVQDDVKQIRGNESTEIQEKDEASQIEDVRLQTGRREKRGQREKLFGVKKKKKREQAKGKDWSSPKRTERIRSSTNGRYGLRNRITQLLVIFAIIIQCVNGKECRNNKGPENATRIYQEACRREGTVVFQQADGNTCYTTHTCPEKTNIQVNPKEKAICGVQCKCGTKMECSHYYGPLTANSTVQDVQVVKLLHANIVDTCSPKTGHCQQEKVSELVNQIRLFDDNTFWIKKLHIRHVQGTTPFCIGQKRKGVTGTANYCASNKCDAEGTEFCLIPNLETVFAVFDEGMVAIKEWGVKQVNVYPYAKRSHECDSCNVTCTKGGIIVTLDAEITTIEVESKKQVVRLQVEGQLEYDVILTHSTVMSKYAVTTNFYGPHGKTKTIHVQCPAGDFCERIRAQCTICWSMVRNLHCAPRVVVILLMVAIYLLGSAVSVLLTLIMYFTGCSKVIVRGLCCAGRGIRGCIRWSWRKTRGRGNRQRLIPKKVMVMVIAAMLFDCALSCDKVSVIQARNEDCVEGSLQTTCTMSTTVDFETSNVGEEVCLFMQRDNTTALGYVKVELKRTYMVCEKRTTMFTRAFEAHVASSKRCPGMGSCSGQKCAAVTAQTRIPELADANDLPGYTRCAESCGCAGCGCFLCSEACTFYRPHARPVSEAVYEIFDCPTWEVAVDITMTIQTNEKEVTQHHILRPGRMATFDDISIRLNHIVVPPMPVMNAKFLSDGKRMAILDEDRFLTLSCRNREEARWFRNCTLLHTTCECSVMGELANCDCISGREIENQANKYALPRRLQNYWILEKNREVVVETNISSVDVQLSLGNTHVKTWTRLQTCQMQEISVSGCHSCAPGALVEYVCLSSGQKAVGHVQCPGTTFAVTCSKEVMKREQNMAFGRSRVDEICELKCSGGTGSFRLQGQLGAVDLIPNGDHYASAKQSIPIIATNVFELLSSEWRFTTMAASAAVFLFVVASLFKGNRTDKKRR